MLRWAREHTRIDKIKNEAVREKVSVAPIKDKIREGHPRWIGHVERRPSDASVGRCKQGLDTLVKRGRGRAYKHVEGHN